GRQRPFSAPSSSHKPGCSGPCAQCRVAPSSSQTPSRSRRENLSIHRRTPPGCPSPHAAGFPSGFAAKTSPLHSRSSIARAPPCCRPAPLRSPRIRRGSPPVLRTASSQIARPDKDVVVFQYFLHMRVTSHELIAEITGSPKSLAHARTHVCCTRGTQVAAVQ